MAELNLHSPVGLYGPLHSVGSYVAAGDWVEAAQWCTNTSDECHRLITASPPDDLDAWHELRTGLEELQLTITAHDIEGCHEVLADLRARLAGIAGPEPGPAV